jgi:integrase
MQEPKKIRGHGTVEKDKRYKNTWKIRFNTGEKDGKGRYIRSPKRTVHGSKADAYAALEAYIAEYEHSQDPANQTIAEYAWHFHELRHTQATLLQGVVSPKAAQHRLGHNQISMTMNTYAHFLDAEDIAVAEAMDGILKPKKADVG